MAEVMIRLKRLAGKKRFHNRIVVVPKTRSRDGRVIEEIGHYDPSGHPPALKLDVERARFWIGRGAKPSPTVGQLMKKTSSAP